jgi:flagellar biosynthesis/type III secretory pathway chaperone
MKRSELRKIVEDTYVDLSKSKIGDTKIDPVTGVKSTLTAINPETGKLTWDISYEADPEQVYEKLSELVDYMSGTKSGTELGKIKEILKTLKNKTSRLIKKPAK